MSKRTIAIIGAVAAVLVIALLYGLVGRSILRERERQTVLEDQILSLESAQAGGSEGVQVLSARQAELATAQAELAASRFAFPAEVDSTEVLAFVVAAADDKDVALRTVRARDPVTTTVGVGASRVLAYDVDVEGELDAIAGFLAALETGPVDTLILDEMHIEAQPAAIYRISLAVHVYFRQ